MTSKYRTHQMEKLARIYDKEILPVWSQRFGQLLLRDLVLPEKGQILDVACGTGYPTTELVRLKGDGTRLIAIEGAAAMLDVARKKLEGEADVFLRSQAAEPSVGFADGVYDLVICNLAIDEMSDPEERLADFARVTRLGGEVRVTLPLKGTFSEFFDIYREVLIKHDKHDAYQRLKDYIESRYPTVAECERWMASAGLEDVSLAVEEFHLLFRSSREFFFAPVIEFGPLAEWKAVAGSGKAMQDVFWYIKDAIDSYFEGRAFEVTVRAGCLRGIKAAATVGKTSGNDDDVDADDTKEAAGESREPSQ